MRISCTNTRALQPRWVILLPNQMLVWYISCIFWQYVLLMHYCWLNVVECLFLNGVVVIVRSVWQRATDPICLYHSLIHISRIWNTSSVGWPSHRSIANMSAILVSCHVLVENNVAICLVRVFLNKTDSVTIDPIFIDND